MREFSLSAYKQILVAFRANGYAFLRFEDYLTKARPEKFVILRHDVDRFPVNALRMAEMESREGMRSTYFFRIIPSVYKPVIMKAIADMGHEVAYHYEDLTLASGDKDKALRLFSDHLDMIRKIYPARTLCMHGSPLSKWDNKMMWENFKPHYSDFGVIGDTSLDVDYNEVFYITDNGWGWNKTSTSVRDKVLSHFDIPIRDTDHFLQLTGQGGFPDRILFNTHPDSFFEPYLLWLLNKIFIQSKNLVKRQIVKYQIIK